MQTIFRVFKDFPRYALSGAGAFGSIFLLLAFWEFGHTIYGELVLPSVVDTLKSAADISLDPITQSDLIKTLSRALWGIAISLLLGTVLGVIAGIFVSASILARPLVTILMGIAPIAWIVLAMIWFGLSDMTVIFTVVITSFPIVFAGALQGARTLEGDLKEMANAFGLPPYMKIKDLYLPHLFSYLIPSWITAFGMGWKIAIMAELLASNDGAGALLGVARSQLDTQNAMAIVVLTVAVLLIVEYLILEPVKREVEAWRNS